MREDGHRQSRCPKSERYQIRRQVNVRTHFEFLSDQHFPFASSNPGIASSAKVSDIMDMGIVERTSSLQALQSFFSQ
jgi:hypothetical protein